LHLPTGSHDQNVRDRPAASGEKRGQRELC
jgi:hypothetical protein